MSSVHEVKFFIGEFFKENQTKAIKSPIFCCTQQLFTNSKKLLWLIFIHSYHFDNNLKRMLKQWNVCIKKINTIKNEDWLLLKCHKRDLLKVLDVVIQLTKNFREI